MWYGLVRAPEVSEDVGPQSPQNFVPEFAPVSIILQHTDGLRIKEEGFSAMEDVGIDTLKSTEIMEERGSRGTCFFLGMIEWGRE